LTINSIAKDEAGNIIDPLMALLIWKPAYCAMSALHSPKILYASCELRALRHVQFPYCPGNTGVDE